jgi:hypothetical protein
LEAKRTLVLVKHAEPILEPGVTPNRWRLSERGAHGTVISLLVARHNDLDAYALWRSRGLPSFCVLSAEGLRLREAVPNLKT